jgi:hypothetical protein
MLKSFCVTLVLQMFGITHKSEIKVLFCSVVDNLIVNVYTVNKNIINVLYLYEFSDHSALTWRRSCLFVIICQYS